VVPETRLRGGSARLWSGLGLGAVLPRSRRTGRTRSAGGASSCDVPDLCAGGSVCIVRTPMGISGRWPLWRVALALGAPTVVLHTGQGHHWAHCLGTICRSPAAVSAQDTGGLRPFRPDDLPFPPVIQVWMIERHVTDSAGRYRRPSLNSAWPATNLPGQPAGYVQGQWTIQTLNSIRDTRHREDQSTVRTPPRTVLWRLLSGPAGCGVASSRAVSSR
jgi:hypothetical protein